MSKPSVLSLALCLGLALCLSQVKCSEASPGMRILLDQKCGFFGYETIAGSHSIIASRPWMALLKFKTKLDGEQFLCSGTLITNRYILTAAHCLKDEENELVSVRLGKHIISSEGNYDSASIQNSVEDFGIESVFKHEEYSEETAQNDIALIKLARDVDYQTHIQPICLPLSSRLQRVAEELPSFRLTGWGKNEFTHFSNIPTEVLIPRMDRSECENFYNRYIDMSQICAAGRGRDSSPGDGGGPLAYLSSLWNVERFVQFGIVSYWSETCGDEKPEVYTNVASFIPWIADKIGNH